MIDEQRSAAAVESDDRSYEAPALQVLGTVKELAAANEDSQQVTTVVGDG